MAMKVYIGSSWKNAAALDAVHAAFLAQGFETWDFRRNGFWWKDVDARYLEPFEFINAPESVTAFEYDKKGLDAADCGMFVLPAGISTALEAGYLAGRGKPIAVWGTPREERMDIMWRFAIARADARTPIEDIVSTLRELVTARWP